MSSLEVTAAGPLPTAEANVDAVEKTDSEYECELMIEALKKELGAVRNHLAYLTHHLCGGDGGSRLSHQQPKTDTSHKLQHASLSRSPGETDAKSYSSDGGGPLVNLLGLEATDGVASTKRSQKQRARKLTRGTKDTSEAEEKEKSLHYLKVVDDAEKRSWEARKRCLVLMQAHIEEQLRVLQERSERFKRKLAIIKKRERTEKLKLKPPRFKSTGTDDVSFLAKVHQSTFYKIIGLEHELKVEGKLRTLTDLKEFWDNMLAPTRSTSAAEPPPFAPPLGHGRPSSTPFTLDEDEEEEEYSDSWAITALPRQHSCTPRKVHTITPITPSTPETLRFVPMKVPEFKTVADILGSDKSKFNPVDSESVCHYRSRELEVERRTLHHMYQQARAHEMVMQRLLPEVPSFKQQPVFADKEKKDRDKRTKKHLPKQDRVPLHHQLEQSHVVRPSEDLEKETRTDTSSKTERLGSETVLISPTLDVGDAERKKGDSYVVDTTASASTPAQSSESTATDKIQEPVLVPLTMDVAMNNFPVRESKQKSSLWTNYLKAGRCS